ncbi:hypothetical protein [Arthrobacter sp. YC-RL1]|uniref:hypothetical protein n=1 Tax=Arthrobacter sp. YC-RL1 TaxID=1652545 RepID=UPI00128C0D37|nr:hypothetical protein [Arthrobacter sp. YC-RL1]
MVKGVFDYGDIKLEYRLRYPSKDRRHLIVVFSGGFVGGYDFGGESFTRLNCAILWIRDELNTYYIQHEGNTEYQVAVQSLISRTMQELFLDKSDVTFLGLSKGGTGALFHGLKYDFNNIVVSVPRIYPARGNIESRPEIVRGLVGSDSLDAIKEFDCLLPNLLKTAGKQKNIYLFSSTEDAQYQTDILPTIEYFREFENFNFVLTSSPNVQRHEDVSLYNIPIISAVISMLIDGIVPRYGEVANGAFSQISSKRQQPTLSYLDGSPVAILDEAQIDARGLYLSGRGFLLNFDASDYGSVKRTLILRSSKNSIRFPLGSLMDRRNNRDFNQGTGHDYSAGSFASKGNMPTNLEELPYGFYEFSMEILQAGVKKTVYDFEGRSRNELFTDFEAVYHLRFHDKKMSLTKIPFGDTRRFGAAAEIDFFRINKNKLEISGKCLVDNVDYSQWSDVQYQLAFRSDQHSEQSRVVNLAKRRSTQRGQHFRAPNVVNFTTPKSSAITIEKLVPGSYDLYLIAMIKDSPIVFNLEYRVLSSSNGETICSSNSVSDFRRLINRPLNEENLRALKNIIKRFKKTLRR